VFASEVIAPAPNGNGVGEVPVGALGWRVLICLLGPFRVLSTGGQAVPVRGEKLVAVLCHLALRYHEGVPRDALLHALWPGRDTVLAVEALHSRLYRVQRLLGEWLDGAAPVVYAAGRYRLNGAAGVGADVACFEALAGAGDRHARAGDPAASGAAFRLALQLYQGDLWAEADDLQALVERERLRARYLGLLARLADQAYGARDHAACLGYAQRLLECAPCREDAHRAIMRCHVRLGERAQAFAQYRLCTQILRAEYGVAPERATTALYEQVRLDPGLV
jgi:DNA-binding SARP family transcriptional activator